MDNEIIIPGKLEAKALSDTKKLGFVTDEGIILLNSEYEQYKQTKKDFCTVCNMGAPQLLKQRLSHPGKKDLHGQNLKLAAEIEWSRRKAASILGDTL